MRKTPARRRLDLPHAGLLGCYRNRRRFLHSSDEQEAPMSVHVTSWVLKHSEAKLGDRLVLLVLADHAKEDGSCAWPSVDTIASEARLSRRATQDCLRRLEAAGAITETGRSESGTHISTVNMRGGAESAPLGGVQMAHGGADSAPKEVLMKYQEAVSVGTSVTTDVVPKVPTATARAAPKLVRVNGRDLAFDTLASVTNIDPSGPNGRTIAMALNGTRAAPGIREQFAAENRVLEAGPSEMFEQQLADAIQRRATAYRQRMRGALLTPTALAKWWTDLPNMNRGGGALDAARVAADELERIRGGAFA
jgi:hypothetical protein